MNPRAVAKWIALLPLVACIGPAEESELRPRGSRSNPGSRSNGGVVGVGTSVVGAGSDVPPSEIVDPPALPDGPVTTVPVNCTLSGGLSVGNGEITRTTRVATNFTRVAADLVGEVVIQEGKAFRVQIETDSNAQPVLTTDVDASGALVIEASRSFCTNFMRAVVTMPVIRGVESTGPTVFTVKKQTPSDIELMTLSSGDITFSGNALALILRLQGVGNIHLVDGSAKTTDVLLAGSGSVDATRFVPGTVTRVISGEGTVRF